MLRLKRVRIKRGHRFKMAWKLNKKGDGFEDDPNRKSARELELEKQLADQASKINSLAKEISRKRPARDGALLGNIPTTRISTYAGGNMFQGGGSPPGPNGAAGGDLTGFYPDPTLVPIITAGGPIGSSTAVPVITWDVKGRLTAVSSAAISIASTLDDLTDVDAPSPSDGDVLTWDDANSEWIPAAPSGGSVTYSKAIYIEQPSASEKIGFFHTDFAITITKVHAVIKVVSSGSVTFNMPHGTDFSAAGTNLFSSGQTESSSTGGTEYTSFNDATLAADEMLWITTSAVTGTVPSMMITVYYTI